MRTVSFHQIDAANLDYLYVKISQLPNAGKGLYTAIAIYKEERIAIFNGIKRNVIAAQEYIATGLDQYFMVLSEGRRPRRAIGSGQLKTTIQSTAEAGIKCGTLEFLIL